MTDKFVPTEEELLSELGSIVDGIRRADIMISTPEPFSFVAWFIVGPRSELEKIGRNRLYSKLRLILEDLYTIYRAKGRDPTSVPIIVDALSLIKRT